MNFSLVGQQLEDVSSHGSRQSGMGLSTFVTNGLMRDPVCHEQGTYSYDSF